MKEKLEQLTKIYNELKQFVIESTKDNPLQLISFRDGEIIDPETGEEMGMWDCCGYTEDNSPMSGIVYKVQGDDVYLYVTNGGYDETPEDDEEVENCPDIVLMDFDSLTLHSQSVIIEKLIKRTTK